MSAGNTNNNNLAEPRVDTNLNGQPNNTFAEEREKVQRMLQEIREQRELLQKERESVRLERDEVRRQNDRETILQQIHDPNFELREQIKKLTSDFSEQMKLIQKQTLVISQLTSSQQKPQETPVSSGSQDVSYQDRTTQNIDLINLNGRVDGGKSDYGNMDVKLPTFDAEHGGNPKEFLKNIERYLTIKRIKGMAKIIVVGEALVGRAKLWYEANEFEEFAVFRDAFLEEFCSIPIQARLRLKWANRRYQQRDGTLVEYYYQQLKEAQYLEPRPTEYEIRYTIVSQMPEQVRSSMAAVNYNDSSTITQALSSLDSVHLERGQHQGYTNKSAGTAVQVKSLQTQNGHQQNKSTKKQKQTQQSGNENRTNVQQTNTNYASQQPVNFPSQMPLVNQYHPIYSTQSGQYGGQWVHLPDTSRPPPSIPTTANVNTFPLNG